MKNYQIIMESVSNATLKETETPELKPDQVLIRNFYTVVSAGTERAWSMDMPNAHPTFPYMTGYCGAGEVVQVGDAVSKVKVGDRVVVNWAGHQLYSVKDENLVRIPEKVSMLDAAFAHIASFSFNGVRKLHLEIGESAMVAGQGILGVFALQVALLCGAVPMIVSDFSPERRALAMKLGADYALNPGDKDYLDQIREITGGEGVRAIVEVTGSAAALQRLGGTDCPARLHPGFRRADRLLQIRARARRPALRRAHPQPGKAGIRPVPLDRAGRLPRLSETGRQRQDQGQSDHFRDRLPAEGARNLSDARGREKSADGNRLRLDDSGVTCCIKFQGSY